MNCLRCGGYPLLGECSCIGKPLLRGGRPAIAWHLLEACITDVTIDGDLAWLTVEFPGGTTAVLKVCISEIEWRNQ